MPVNSSTPTKSTTLCKKHWVSPALSVVKLQNAQNQLLFAAGDGILFNPKNICTIEICTRTIRVPPRQIGDSFTWTHP